MEKKILVVDDEPELRKLLARLLGMEGYQVIEAESGDSALKKIREEDVMVVLSDVRMPGTGGLELLKKIKEFDPSIEVIMLTAYGRIEDGVESIKLGAFDYITKGDEDNKIVPVVDRAFEKISLKRKIEQLEKHIARKGNFNLLTGSSDLIARVRELGEKVAPRDVPVLITGETGTGKEVLAHAIHTGSKRGNTQMVVINCAAIPRELMESELFGYKAGAFTGAVRNKKGLFEEAHNGTLFLDEIGELDVAAQSKLLRVIETGTFIKSGDTQPVTVDVRVIAATSRELEEEIKKGNFRSDLFYRLNVFRIELPPLRKRPGDIRQLTDDLLADLNHKSNSTMVCDEEVYKALEGYDFPGNIRELRNILERAMILSSGDRISLRHLPPDIVKRKQPCPAETRLEEVEREHILKVLEECGNNKARAASLLGISQATLFRKLKEFTK